jgi:hypothetical protein
VFTDAPEITCLDTSRNPFSTAKLGKIGQECSPPYIENVIEWLRPDWASGLPRSGSDESRVLQKVVTLASATTEKPLIVDLKVAGLELEAGSSEEDSSEDSSDVANYREQVERIVDGGFEKGLCDIEGCTFPDLELRFEYIVGSHAKRNKLVSTYLLMKHFYVLAHGLL